MLTGDLNDAPRGRSLGQYQDNYRELPATTGVISVKDLLTSLVQIGYGGPVQG